jgi:hypothetical protein
MDERDAAQEGLVHYITVAAALAAEGLVGPAQVEWLDRVRDDLDSYRTVLAWLIEHGRAAEASDIAWKLMFFWIIRGHAAEGLRWYEQILNLPSLPPATESRALVGAAAMWYTQGAAALTRARAAIERAWRLAHDTGDREMIAHASIVSGHVEFASGNAAAARERFAGSINAFRALGIPWGAGNAMSGMAGAALMMGDASVAERLVDEATSVLQQAGPWFRSLALYVSAILAVRRGKADEAIVVVRQSLASIRELHDNFAFVTTLVPLAAAAVLKGDDAWAARLLGARSAVVERTGATVVDRSVEDLREQAERAARARLGEHRWGRAYAAGRVSSIDSLMTEIDAR